MLEPLFSGEPVAHAAPAIDLLPALVDRVGRLDSAVLLDQALRRRAALGDRVWFGGRQWLRAIAEEVQAAFHLDEPTLHRALRYLEAQHCARVLVYRPESGGPDILFLSPEPELEALADALAAGARGDA